jgi:hypothetical protein
MQTSINNIINSYNESPIQDFEGLSPNQIQLLSFHIFELDNPLQINDSISNETLDKINFFRLCVEFLKIIQRKNGLKLSCVLKCNI